MAVTNRVSANKGLDPSVLIEGSSIVGNVLIISERERRSTITKVIRNLPIIWVYLSKFDIALLLCIVLV